MLERGVNQYTSSVVADGVPYEIQFDVEPDTTRFAIYHARVRYPRTPIATGTIRPGVARYDEPTSLALDLDRQLHETYLDLCERLP